MLEVDLGPVVADLNEAYRVIQPATTLPRRLRSATLDRAAGELIDAAIDAGLERWVVLGYALGMGVAVRAAARRRDRVTGLVLITGLGYPDHQTRLALDIWSVALATSAAARADLAAIKAPTLVVANIVDRVTGSPLPQQLATGIATAELVEVETRYGAGGSARQAWLTTVHAFVTNLTPAPHEPWRPPGSC